jgi:Na+-transporting NADH:ubiquinone oxidoreductase subunit NqrB
MTRDRSLDRSPGATVTGKVADMKSWRYIALHTAAAAVFIFVLQRYALNASLETSLLWALMFGGCAAGLAYMQSNR